jgi:2-methylisocitrate lyase-like PEP mutase family enzyme
MPAQIEKAHAFRALHERDKAFIIPNPWDIGTARMLSSLGFEALATTSAGFAFSTGRPDYGVDRNEMLAHLRAMVAATALPVSADLENGFGDEPEVAAETIRLAAAAGVVGGSIEDATSRTSEPIYDFAQAVDRVRAAAEAAHKLSFPFTLTARCENYLVGRADLRDTIQRLQAYQEAGADVLYSPGVSSKEDIRAVVGSVDRPVNVLMGLQGARLNLAELTQLGVKRVSVGSALSRAALGAFLSAASEMREHGTFNFVDGAASSAQIGALLKNFDA